MCNAGGDKEGDRFMGGSGVWVPLRGKIGGFERNEIGMRVVDLDLRVVEVSPFACTTLTCSTAVTCTKSERTGVNAKHGDAMHANVALIPRYAVNLTSALCLPAAQ
jgi:hypothetical protein